MRLFLSKLQKVVLGKISNNRQAGVTLLLAILILSSVLAISFSLATVMFIEVRDSGDLLKTEPSLYAATGIGEQAFFNIERHICTGSGCSYTSGFSNNVSLNGVAILSTSTPIFIDKVKTGATFPNPLNNYYFCNVNPGFDPITNKENGCNYGKVTVSYITTNSNNYTLKAYLCEFNPNPTVPYSTAPCTLADKSQGYWNAPNGSDLSSLNSDGSVSMTANTNSSVSWTLNPSLQQQLILTNDTGQGDIYVKIATFDTYGTIGKGLPYVGETAVQVNTTNASVGRKIQVIVPNSASSGVAASLPVTTQFSVSGPSSATVGVPFSSPVEVRALDANSNTVTGYTGTVHFSGGGGGASLPSSYTFTGGDAGVHDFAGVTLNTAGTQTITVTDTGNSSITGTSNGILVVSSCNTSAVGTDQMVGCAFNDSDGSYLTNVNGNAPVEPKISGSEDNATVLPDNNIMSGWSGMASGFQYYNGYPISYSMRWKGTFTFSGGNYSFSAGSDDGERVYVDGSKVWEAAWPGGRGYSVDTFTVPISAGSHIITYEYFQGGGGAEYSLSWGLPVISNVALSSNGATAVPSSEILPSYPASSAINGDRTGAGWGSGTGGWNDNTCGTYPDTLEVDFAGSKTISEIDMYTLADSFPTTPNMSTPADVYGIADFQVQYYNGSSWVTVPGGSVTNNALAWRQFTFAAISNVPKIRVYITRDNDNCWSRIVELEAYGY